MNEVLKKSYGTSISEIVKAKENKKKAEEIFN